MVVLPRRPMAGPWPARRSHAQRASAGRAPEGVTRHGGRSALARAVTGRAGRGPGRSRRLLALSLLAALAVAACGSPGGSAGGTKGPVVIGTSLSLSGDFSADGQYYEQGYKLWAAYQNAHGGLLGRKIKLDILSDGSSPSQVVTNYQKLIKLDGVNLTFGPFSTLLAVPSQKVANRYGYALITGAGGGTAAFAAKLHNYFVVTGSAARLLNSFADWLTSLPASQRPKTIAYATSDDPFAEPAVLAAKKIISAAGIKTAYFKVFPAEVTDYTPIADGVAASKAQAVVIGSTAVPDIAPIIQRFVTDHYQPQAIIGESGPDQGATFANAVGLKNTEGIMYPNDWYPGIKNPGSQAMVQDYVRTYGGEASNVSADIAEAFTVGQVLTAAVKATHSISNSKIIAYLHSGASISTVLGTVRFSSLGYNVGSPTIDMQWQHGKSVQVIPVGAAGTSKIEFPRPAWGCGTCG